MFRERARTLQGISLTLDVVCICLAFGAAVGEQVLWGLVPALERWLPARLAFALVDLVEENEPVDYLPTVAVTIVLSGAAYATAIRLLERREV